MFTMSSICGEMFSSAFTGNGYYLETENVFTIFQIKLMNMKLTESIL